MKLGGVSQSNQVKQANKSSVKKETPYKVIETVTISWEDAQKQMTQPRPEGMVSKPVTVGKFNEETLVPALHRVLGNR